MNNRISIAKDFANSIKTDNIQRIILFGSVARGEDTEESDIDILIISNYYDEIEPIISDKIARIVLENQELISAHIMSEEHFNKTKHFSFLTNVLKDGVEIG